MTRRVWFSLGAYAVLMGSVLTPLYEPLGFGESDEWAVGVLLGAAQVGVGAGVARRWALLLPFAWAMVAWGVAGEGYGYYVFFVVAGSLVGVGLVAIGLAASRWSSHGGVIATVAFAACIPTFAWGAFETVDRIGAPHLPKAEQAALPTSVSLGNLCGGSDLPVQVREDLRKKADALITELGRRHEWLVDYTYYFSDLPKERRHITVQELAEEQLNDLEHCRPPGTRPVLEARLRGALE